MSLKQKKISLSSLEPEQILSAHSYVQAYREDGFRMEHEVIEDKDIFHNYGQGDSEFSLAFGCAHILSKIMSVKKDISKIRSVAVIGSSINALFTTLELLKRGYKVTLYSDDLPNDKGSSSSNYRQGLQFWYPGFYDNCDPLRHELLSKISFQFYKESLTFSRYQSLSWMDCVVMGPKAEGIENTISDFIIEGIGETYVDFGNQKVENATLFRSILIDTELFCQELYTQIRLRNAIIVHKTFHSLEDVLSVPQNQIFNCLGVASRTIFSDMKVHPIRTHFLECQQAKKDEEYLLWKSFEQQGEDDVIICHWGGRTFIQNSWEDDKQEAVVDQSVADRLFSKAYHFVKERTMKPTKL